MRTAALIQGTAIPDLEAPDRVLIGGDDPAAIAALAFFGHDGGLRM